MFFQCLSLLIALVLLCVLPARGYVPAQPSNVTSRQADASSLHLQWYTNGSDWESVARQPPSVGSNFGSDPVQGILVHFSEDNAGTDTTTTPWIAFVSCDANSTNSSLNTDIFTMAKDRGAKSAILYSLYSETCVTNPDLVSVLDVFTTQTLNASRRIEYEFGHFGPHSEAYYGYFHAAMLNDAARVTDDAIALNRPASPGFLFATLPVYHASSTIEADASATPPSSAGGDSQGTGVAMIVLYAITGCVSALFCGVIVSGVIRAVRHPERYGPRWADATGGGQSRAGGLGRAILDTFPVVKFGSSGNDRNSSFSRAKDIESTRVDADSTPPPSNSVQLVRLSHIEERDEQHHDPREAPDPTASQEAREDDQTSDATDQVNSLPQIRTADPGPSRVSAPVHEIVPESIGRETCPICIFDFEEGDDLRVLPCEGKHRFHQSCVDSWLLELSASCPLCRQDFRALETIISGAPENEALSNSDSAASLQYNRRFSRYLRFALGRQRRVNSEDPRSMPPSES